MVNTLQHTGKISGTCGRAASAALALAAVLLSAAAAMPSVQAQTLTTLYSFGGTDGANPQAPLVQGINGNLYGTTLNGGTSTNGTDGTVFEITPGGALTTLHSFCLQSGCPDGYHPTGLVQATNGKWYGTTEDGGSGCCGTVFKITSSGKLTTLDSFPAQDGSGPYPTAGLVQATNGNLYGTTVGGGANGAGAIYRITASGALTTIYSFCPVGGVNGGCSISSSADNGYTPLAALVEGTNGDLYGTTYGGGVHGSYGTVFKITPTGALTTLYSFCAKSNTQSNCLDGSGPASGLVQASNGNFYGTTNSGGANCAPSGCGTVFEITPSGKLTTRYSFCSQSACADGNIGGNGEESQPAPIQATDGNLYGTTTYGGATGGGSSTDGYGTIFRITPGGALTTLYTFCMVAGCKDGGQPGAGLVQATDGSFYGTTYTGGTNSPTAGTVFSFSVGLGPFVKTLPTSGRVGAAVKILGTDLTGATGVSFNGIAAAFTFVSATEITTTVPTGATTGKIQVATPNGTLSSNVNFVVTP